MHLSIVIPAFNEEQSITELAAEILNVLSDLPLEYEIIFVDDASTDTTAQQIRFLVQKDNHIRGYSLHRTTKKGGSLAVGFAEAHGEIIISMDADLQDDPAEIPRFLEGIERGADVVNGWKQDRVDRFSRKALSFVMNTLSNVLLHKDFHDMNCGYKAYRASVAKQIQAPGSLYRFIPHILSAQGYDVREVPIHHRSRKYGVSKFGILHRLRGPVDLIRLVVLIRFGSKPLEWTNTVPVGYSPITG